MSDVKTGEIIQLLEQGLRNLTGFEIRTKIDRIEGLENVVVVQFRDDMENDPPPDRT